MSEKFLRDANDSDPEIEVIPPRKSLLIEISSSEEDDDLGGRETEDTISVDLGEEEKDDVLTPFVTVKTEPEEDILSPFVAMKTEPAKPEDVQLDIREPEDFVSPPLGPEAAISQESGEEFDGMPDLADESDDEESDFFEDDDEPSIILDGEEYELEEEDYLDDYIDNYVDNLSDELLSQDLEKTETVIVEIPIEKVKDLEGVFSVVSVVGGGGARVKKDMRRSLELIDYHMQHDEFPEAELETKQGRKRAANLKTRHINKLKAGTHPTMRYDNGLLKAKTRVTRRYVIRSGLNEQQKRDAQKIIETHQDLSKSRLFECVEAKQRIFYPLVYDEGESFSLVRKIHLKSNHMKTKEKIEALLEEEGLIVFDLPLVLEDVKKKCDVCPLVRTRQQVADTDPVIVVETPRSLMGTDLAFLPRTKDGYVGFLLVEDLFTKYLVCLPFKSKDKYVIGATMSVLMKRFETSEDFPFGAVWSDCGSEYNNDVFREVVKNCGVFNTILSRPRNPVKPVERANQTIKAKVESKILEVGDTNIWTKVLDDVCTQYNNQKHSTLGMSPNEVERAIFVKTEGLSNEVKQQILMERASLIQKIRDTMIKRGTKDKIRRQKSKVKKNFSINDHVLVKIPDEYKVGKEEPAYSRVATLHKRVFRGMWRLRWGITGGVVKEEKPGTVSLNIWPEKLFKAYESGSDYLLRSYGPNNVFPVIPKDQIIVDEDSKKKNSMIFNYEREVFKPMGTKKGMKQMVSPPPKPKPVEAKDFKNAATDWILRCCEYLGVDHAKIVDRYFWRRYGSKRDIDDEQLEEARDILMHGDWLNDFIINLFCERLDEISKRVEVKNCFVATVIDRDMKYDPESLVRIWRKFDFEAANRIVLPFNIENIHWVCGSLDFSVILETVVWRFFDSIFTEDHLNRFSVVKRSFEHVSRTEEMKGLKLLGEVSCTSDWEKVKKDQTGGNCGVHVLMYCCSENTTQLDRSFNDDCCDLMRRIIWKVIESQFEVIGKRRRKRKKKKKNEEGFFVQIRGPTKRKGKGNGESGKKRRKIGKKK